MKKAITIIISMLIAILTISCGKTETETNTTTNTTTTTEIITTVLETTSTETTTEPDVTFSIIDESSDITVSVPDTVNVDEIKEQIEVASVLTQFNTVCVFIKNNSQEIIDELSLQIVYKNSSGDMLDVDDDGHDMILPGQTVVTNFEAPNQFNSFETSFDIELGVHPKYENHLNDVTITSSVNAENEILLDVINNSTVKIDEIEVIAVLYSGDSIVYVTRPTDIYKINAGSEVFEKLSTYHLNDEFDRYEIYVNQAHTFGF